MQHIFLLKRGLVKNARMPPELVGTDGTSNDYLQRSNLPPTWIQWMPCRPNGDVPGNLTRSGQTALSAIMSSQMLSFRGTSTALGIWTVHMFEVFSSYQFATAHVIFTYLSHVGTPKHPHPPKIRIPIRNMLHPQLSHDVPWFPDSRSSQQFDARCAIALQLRCFPRANHNAMGLNGGDIDENIWKL